MPRWLEFLLAVFILWPALALVPAVLLWLLHRRARTRALLWVAGAWVIYGVYEFGMQRRLLCSGECNIRVDLLMIYPALWLATLVACVVAINRIVRKPQ